ncbi:tripartite motif-containing protein 59-like [Patiria miniata]|uniref:Uncharacterized protein n=1 Tax=Patiria miniata TaxID=46514 RepID=A0A914B6R4_PATMI|nr:tripartite motif-containing protein 59-like [Patiria miniata]
MAEEGTRPAVLERITDDHLKCSICRELYKELKTLSCLHRFCMQCLVTYRQSHWDSDHLMCPLCRQQTSVPGGDIRNLATDFAPASLEEVVQKEYGPTIQTCSIHEQGKCELFCETCTKLICLTCLTESHKRHEFKEVRRMNIADKRKRIKDKIPQYQKSVADLTQALQSVDKEKRDFAVAMVRLKEEVEGEARVMKDKVDDSKRSILRQLDQIQTEREKELKDFSHDLNFMRKTTQKLLDESNLVLETNHQYVFLQKYTSTGMGSLGKNRRRIPSMKNNPVVTFTPCEKDIPVGKVLKHSTIFKIKGLMIDLVWFLKMVMIAVVMFIGLVTCVEAMVGITTKMAVLSLVVMLCILKNLIKIGAVHKMKSKMKAVVKFLSMVMMRVVMLMMLVTLVVMMIGKTTIIAMMCWVITSMFCIL